MKYFLNKIQSHHLVLIFILFIAFVLRVYHLDTVPLGFARDEASVGYNAYSILKTGKDEYGRFMPLAFEAFGDWKLPLNIYFAVPFVAIFGLSVLAVRLSVAVFGVLSILIVYFLAEEFRKNFLKKATVWFSLISSMLLAVSPWHIYMSRTAFGHNVIALFFFMFGFYLFLRNIRYKKNLIIPILFFTSTLFIYTSYHLFLPLFLLGTGFVFRKELAKNYNIALLLLVFILLFVFSQAIFWKANITKIPGSSITSDANLIYSRIERKQNEHLNNSIIVKAFHNKLLIYPYQIAMNYLNAFSTQFLFNKGGENLINNLEEMGNLYFLEAALILFGFYYLIKQNNATFLKLLLLWFFLSPLPGAFTKDAPHSTRTFAMVGSLVFIEAYGIISVILLRSKYFFKALFFILMLGYLLGVLLFLEIYFVHFPVNRSRYWAYGYEKIANLTRVYENHRVVFSKIFDSPYIFILFYNKYDPAKFHAEAIRGQTTWDGFKPVKKFGRFEFVEAFDWNHVWDNKETLFIDAKETIPKNYPVTGWINYPLGDPAFGWFVNSGNPCRFYYPEKELVPLICR
jgi:4-amino-4-deoxy-L-arabinose transferase-like glycosyltransferase